MTAPDFGMACLSLAAGVVLGLVHFFGLYANTRLYLRPGRAAKAIVLQVGRIAFTTAGLGAMAHVGPPALLAAFAGFLIARPAVRHMVVTSR